MQVTVNGQERAIQTGTTVSALLDELGLGKGPCAVEVNQHLVPKREHAARQLGDGDRIELVVLVGGG